MMHLSCLIESANTAEKDNIDIELRQLANALGLTGIPKAKGRIPSIEEPLPQLGMKLFYSKSLGGEYDTACVSCHHPMLGGGDNLSLPIGTHAENPDILGPDRMLKAGKELAVPRNAPSTFNVIFYQETLFHDGRIQTVENHDLKGISTPDVPHKTDDLLGGDNLVQAQARFPIISHAEMRGDFMPDSHNQTVRRALAERLKKNWLSEFRKGFSHPNGTAKELITEQNISAAIAEYERSQVFINTPWRKYLQGDDKAISKQAKNGALLFFTPASEGGSNCSSCHTGDFFTDEKFHNTAIPQIGIGQGEGKTKSNDYGCYTVTKKEEDKFRFRTPHLLNVEVTGPWGHDGAYTTLEGISRHMLSPIESVKHYDKKQVSQAEIDFSHVFKNTSEAIHAGVSIPPIRNFSDDDVDSLVSFLKTLTDPCVKDRECMSPWIPLRHENDPDGMMLQALSRNGQFL